MNADAHARRIADALLAQRKDRPEVPPAGTMGDLLRDYERAKIRELLDDEDQALLKLADEAAVEGLIEDARDPGRAVDIPSVPTCAALWLRRRARRVP